jgi:hypothetical protein
MSGATVEVLGDGSRSIRYRQWPWTFTAKEWEQLRKAKPESKAWPTPDIHWIVVRYQLDQGSEETLVLPQWQWVELQRHF